MIRFHTVLTTAVFLLASPASTRSAEIYSRWQAHGLGELSVVENSDRFFRDDIFSGPVAATFDGLVAGILRKESRGGIYDASSGEIVWKGNFLAHHVFHGGERFAFLNSSDSLVRIIEPDPWRVVAVVDRTIRERSSDLVAMDRLGNAAISGSPLGESRNGLHLWPQERSIQRPEEMVDFEIISLTDSGIVGGHTRVLFEPPHAYFNQIVTRPFRWTDSGGLRILEGTEVGDPLGVFGINMRALAVNDQGLMLGFTTTSTTLAGSLSMWTWNGDTVATWNEAERFNDHGAAIIDTPAGKIFSGPGASPIGFNDPDEWDFLDSVVNPAPLDVNSDWQVLGLREEPAPGGVEVLQLVRYDPLRIAGDYNASGTVEQGDLDLVLLNWGTGEVPAGWLHDPPSGRID